MEKDLYLTEAPFYQTPDTATVIPIRQRPNVAVKSLANPNDRRNQITKKMLCDFPLQSYYDDKKIKPGISLYKIILQTQDRRRDGQFTGPFLQLNLHPTVAFTDNVNTMIYNQNGIIKTMNYISYQQYLSRVNISQQQIKNQQQIIPTIITKCCNGIVFQNNIIMNSEITSKIIPRSENVITTKFIMPFACYPNVIRLFFIPKHVKNMKKNIAYKIINRKQMTQDIYKKKHRLSNQFMINIENQDSYIATLIKGKALEPCQSMAASLCQYLEQSLMVKVFQVVIDFIVDQNKVIYFNDIKSIKSKTKTKIWQIGTEQQIIKMASQNNNQIMCRLCGMLYTKYQMQKLVTNKLIYQLISHLQNRGKKIVNIPHVKKQGLSNVCYLCYQLIKAQHTLINIERQFSQLMNIRQNTIQRVQSKQTKQQQLFFYDEEEFQMLGEQTSKYKKWRLFFYVQKLKRIPEMDVSNAENIQISLQMKFQNQKEKFTKIIKNQNYDPEAVGDMNMSKNWARSIKNNSMHNYNSIKRDSTQSKSNNIRVQSAMPHRQRFKQKNNYQNQQFQRGELVSQYQGQIAGQQAVTDKNKSYFNDETTCVTHSQSYFSNSINDKSINDKSINYSNQLNSFSRPTHHNTTHWNKNNQLQSLYQDPREDSYINMNRNLNFTKNSSFKQNDILNYSDVPSNVKIDKVKMFIFYTKAHQNQGKNILNQQQMQFNLTFTGMNPNNIHAKQTTSFKYTGNSSTLKCLKNKQTCQRHSLEIYLFDQGMKYCNLQLTVGMVCDGVFDDEGLDLERNNNLYWGKTYSCQPLPDEWMEVFTNGQEVPKSNVDKVLEELESNNFCTEPPKINTKIEEQQKVDYIKSFQTFSNKVDRQFELTIKNKLSSPKSTVYNPLSTIALSSLNSSSFNASNLRPMSGIQASQSTSNLKKTSLIRCKTAISRNANSYSNLLVQQKSPLLSSNRNKGGYKNATVEEVNHDDNDSVDFDV